ncbi:Protein-serine/threonine kinase [Meloidogyne graminicola]|uniref:Protein-serine/threonine kinase n=1 Tax=Meloidogyne graminicola TaxID=189291 RepID=A0A8S9ZN38_9BILA|nr:Protein-serine/threonine kinase [Meloidogyne graminicola]
MKASQRLCTAFIQQYNGACSSIEKPLAYYSQFRPVSLTMKQYLDFGRNGTDQSSYLFLKTELLVRMANIMQEFNLLPSKLLQTQSGKQVANLYKQSFCELLQFEGINPSTSILQKFKSQLRSILRRHNTVVETMAEALIELKQSKGIDFSCEQNIQYFLVICHLSLSDPNCCVRDILIDAYENALLLSEQHFCAAPSLSLECFNSKNPGQEIRVPLVPLHLYYIVFELIKNSMRATIEHFYRSNKGQNFANDELPPIRAQMVLGPENLSIKISDRGGGVPAEKLSHLFRYSYSTAPKPTSLLKDGVAPFSGYGYGLPISRLYARYFLGDLSLISMDGYGTDALISLKAIPSQACELLPIFGASSRRLITMGNQAPDYCFQNVENTKIETERKWGDLQLISQKSEDVKQREYIRRAIQ